jgi:hypothetical protein
MGYNSNHSTSKETREHQKKERLGERRLNNQGCLMKVVEYDKTENIVVEFQDKYKAKVITRYNEFAKGKVKNPYYPNVYGGMIGNKYPAKVDGKISKEYFTWKNMLVDCCNRDVSCCEEWLLFDNFYEWLHKQENFERFLNGRRWTISKDIIKNNNVYSPDACFLISQKVKRLFMKRELNTDVSNSVLHAYKEHMENKIKRIAKEELAGGNITEECYKAMMNYKI